MRPEFHAAMRAALEHGPDHCPPDLFEGEVEAVVRGLKAHANTIAHARHVAVEESYPRTRELLGETAFHAAAETHLADDTVLRLPLGHIGQGFAGRLDGPARDLATVEWAWLEAHGARNAPAFDLAAIAGLDAGAVAATPVALHPAARIVALAGPIMWDDLAFGDRYILLTRPLADVTLIGVDEAVSRLLCSLDGHQVLGDLLNRDPAACTVLIQASALTRKSESLP